MTPVQSDSSGKFHSMHEFLYSTLWRPSRLPPLPPQISLARYVLGACDFAPKGLKAQSWLRMNAAASSTPSTSSSTLTLWRPSRLPPHSPQSSLAR